jgi:hypothetical protein
MGGADDRRAAAGGEAAWSSDGSWSITWSWSSPTWPPATASTPRALAAGGTERAAPRVREEYSPRYDAAYVNDPDGNNIDAVHHG